MTKRQESPYYECIGIKDGTLYMLDYIFNDGDGFKGATGTSFCPLSQDAIDERRDIENLKEEYRCLWAEAGKDGTTDVSLDDFIENMLGDADAYNYAFPGHDNSYIEKIPDDIKAKYFPDAVTFECVGGGRCFETGMEYDVIINQKLIDKINEIEGK